MAEVVTYGTAFLTDADRTAMATYLLDPDGTGTSTDPASVIPPIADKVDHSSMNMAQN